MTSENGLGRRSAGEVRKPELVWWVFCWGCVEDPDPCYVSCPPWPQSPPAAHMNSVTSPPPLPISCCNIMTLSLPLGSELQKAGGCLRATDVCAWWYKGVHGESEAWQATPTEAVWAPHVLVRKCSRPKAHSSMAKQGMKDRMHMTAFPSPALYSEE